MVKSMVSCKKTNSHLVGTDVAFEEIVVSGPQMPSVTHMSIF
jgi:hypothetical protein